MDRKERLINLFIKIAVTPEELAKEVSYLTNKLRKRGLPTYQSIQNVPEAISSLGRTLSNIIKAKAPAPLKGTSDKAAKIFNRLSDFIKKKNLSALISRSGITKGDKPVGHVSLGASSSEPNNLNFLENMVLSHELNELESAIKAPDIYEKTKKFIQSKPMLKPLREYLSNLGFFHMKNVPISIGSHASPGVLLKELTRTNRLELPKEILSNADTISQLQILNLLKQSRMKELVPSLVPVFGKDKAKQILDIYARGGRLSRGAVEKINDILMRNIQQFGQRPNYESSLKAKILKTIGQKAGIEDVIDEISQGLAIRAGRKPTKEQLSVVPKEISPPAGQKLPNDITITVLKKLFGL